MPSRVTKTGTTFRSGWRLGVNANWRLRGPIVSFVLGFDALRDRLVLNNYTKASFDQLGPGPDAPPSRERSGTLTINETSLRSKIGLRYDWPRFSLLTAFTIAVRPQRNQVYNFTQTTRALGSLLGGETIVLPEPIASDGSVIFPKDAPNERSYAGLVIGGGFRATESLTFWLELDQGIHVANVFADDPEYRQSFGRMGLMVSYRILGR